jgi:sulfur-oxidizing protein SoxY
MRIDALRGRSAVPGILARRIALRHLVALAAGTPMLASLRTAADETPAEGPLAGTLRDLGSLEAGGRLLFLDLPEVAESGASVPVALRSRVPGDQEILLLVEENPVPLAARFAFDAPAEPSLGIRLRLARSTRVYAVVRGGGRLCHAVRSVRVVEGGCA